ncbi:alpha/beta hydrolase [Kribbella sancticallisti]|uniref:alpha/beta hydrolase n=1 Tax=Kribbella sancticallisti TaxID=460087 RepID=UPI0031CDCF22
MAQTYEVETADERTVKYCLYGAEDGAPVVAHHGTPGSRWERPDVVAAIEDSGLRVLLFGRPGYGSTRKLGRAVVEVAADVAALADAQGWDRFAVTGFSGGGPHAFATAALLPDRVVRCSTVSGIAPPGTAAFESLDWAADARRGETFLRDQLGRSGQDIMRELSSGSDAGRVERMRASCIEGLDGWIDDYLALSKPWGFDPRDVQAPVDVWFGSEDDNSTPAHAEWLLATLPSATAREYVGGHDPDDAVQRLIFGALRGFK